MKVGLRIDQLDRAGGQVARLGLGPAGLPGGGGRAPQLGDDGLATAGATLGIGGTQVSPAAMAAATATVARGAWLPPTLVANPEQPDPEPGQPLPEATVTDLHAAMREVVTSGTGSALADIPGGDVYGKTGTAETGDDDIEHAWFVGWQDDVAVAIFVEDGGSGSGTAVPLAEAFLRALAG